jgi:Na+/melibiose symporter-like transporter
VGSGLWVKAHGFTLPLIVVAALGGVALLWIAVMVPESLPPDAAVRSDALHLNPMQTFRNLSFLYHHKAKLGKSPLLLMSVSFCLYYVTYISFATVVILYCKHVFSWGPDTIGFFDGLDGGVHACSMLFAPLLVHTACQREFSLLNWIQTAYISRSGLSDSVCLPVYLLSSLPRHQFEPFI